jgi:uncharacterized protein (DUF433 family)
MTTDKQRQIALVYRKMPISEQGSDLEYWLSQPPSARLAALEEIQREYHAWKYGDEPRMQKVVAIKKRRGSDYFVVERFTEGRMSVQTLDQHIEITPDVAGGKPRITGRRITVQNIAIWHEYMGLSADEIASEYDLSLGDVYAALAYYFDHRDQIERQIAEDEAFVEALRSQTPSLLREKLSQDKLE